MVWQDHLCGKDTGAGLYTQRKRVNFNRITKIRPLESTGQQKQTGLNDTWRRDNEKQYRRHMEGAAGDSTE